MSIQIGIRVLLGLILCTAGFSANAEDPPTGEKVKAAGGKLSITLPKSWKANTKRSSILEHEFFAPADEEDKSARARIIMMGSGGSIEQNINRWYGQFSQPDGKATKEVAKVEKFEVGDLTVHFVQIPGTYAESIGPPIAGRKVQRNEYRMLGAIIVSKGGGQYFIKMTGPNAVCEKLTDGFKQMLKSIESK